MSLWNFEYTKEVNKLTRNQFNYKRSYERLPRTTTEVKKVREISAACILNSISDRVNESNPL